MNDALSQDLGNLHALHLELLPVPVMWKVLDGGHSPPKFVTSVELSQLVWLDFHPVLIKNLKRSLLNGQVSPLF